MKVTADVKSGHLLGKSLNNFQLVSGINQQVLFSLRNNDGGHFKVNPKSGLIQLAKQLDRETTSSHHITVVATDQVC